jgi:hypothetical protein
VDKIISIPFTLTCNVGFISAIASALKQGSSVKIQDNEFCYKNSQPNHTMLIKTYTSILTRRR